ncbi:PHP domain-containing protein [Selenihalanaerobacter shriftii]|uniref:Putative hydrolase n=1 Tax=Selenihalanaerobacter shriftii TaxID=142842 RepID=A0A1T4KH25_9FIRM|nr:PHP domain-containing protein [Selenihalanaerobacter shriftii]SJZ41720.1 putative hydrolase [Selenihalanaerobacter shriftii]
MRLLADYHTHTNYGHGTGLISNNIQQALEKGLEELAITEHGPASQSLTKLGVKDALQLLEIKNEVSNYNREVKELNILAGVEANIVSLDGDLDIPNFVLEELDIVLAGLHLWIKPQDLKTGKRLIFDNMINYRLGLVSKEEIRYYNTQALINAVEKYDIDIITHPGFQLDIDTIELAKICQKNDTLLEINNSHQQLTTDFINAAAKTGVKFVVNSDAHKSTEIGEVSSALKLLKETNIDLNQVINVV